jgi:hypothetical protein
VSLVALGRSFGFVAADRGLVTRAPTPSSGIPVYASYLLIQSGYLLQSISLRNVLVMVLASGCNVGRALMEERLLARFARLRSLSSPGPLEAGPRSLVTACATALAHSGPAFARPEHWRT